MGQPRQTNEPYSARQCAGFEPDEHLRSPPIPRSPTIRRSPTGLPGHQGADRKPNAACGPESPRSPKSPLAPADPKAPQAPPKHGPLASVVRGPDPHAEAEADRGRQTADAVSDNLPCSHLILLFIQSGRLPHPQRAPLPCSPSLHALSNQHAALASCYALALPVSRPLSGGDRAGSE
jgi:hypothetical protein